MTKDKALNMAIEALESIKLLCNDNRWYLIGNARKACKEALEQPAQEPVAWMHSKERLKIVASPNHQKNGYTIPLYTHTSPSWQGNKEFVGLSDDEIDAVWFEVVKENNFEGAGKYFVRAIEQALKEKNT